jgi:hypothetical protein
MRGGSERILGVPDIAIVAFSSCKDAAPRSADIAIAYEGKQATGRLT